MTETKTEHEGPIEFGDEIRYTLQVWWDGGRSHPESGEVCSNEEVRDATAGDLIAALTANPQLRAAVLCQLPEFATDAEKKLVDLCQELRADLATERARAEAAEATVEEARKLVAKWLGDGADIRAHSDALHQTEKAEIHEDLANELLGILASRPAERTCATCKSPECPRSILGPDTYCDGYKRDPAERAKDSAPVIAHVRTVSASEVHVPNEATGGGDLLPPHDDEACRYYDYCSGKCSEHGHKLGKACAWRTESESTLSAVRGELEHTKEEFEKAMRLWKQATIDHDAAQQDAKRGWGEVYGLMKELGDARLKLEAAQAELAVERAGCEGALERLCQHVELNRQLTDALEAAQAERAHLLEAARISRGYEDIATMDDKRMWEGGLADWRSRDRGRGGPLSEHKAVDVIVSVFEGVPPRVPPEVRIYERGPNGRIKNCSDWLFEQVDSVDHETCLRAAGYEPIKVNE